MIFETIERKLTISGLAVAGETLFRNFMGSEITRGVMIRPPLTGIFVDPYIEGFHKTDIQIITRHVDPVEGVDLANEISKILLVSSPEEHIFPEGKIVLSIFYPKTLPIQFPRLEGNGIEFSQHYFAAYSFKPPWR